MAENFKRLFEVREIRIPPKLYRRISKIHNQHNKTQSEEQFLAEVLRKGVEAIEKEL